MIYDTNYHGNLVVLVAINVIVIDVLGSFSFFSLIIFGHLLLKKFKFDNQLTVHRMSISGAIGNLSKYDM